MSIKLLDTIYKLTDNSDKVDGKHASDFALSSHGVHWEGFTRRANTSATWGTLISSNGYTPLFWMDSTSGGGVAFSDAGGQTFMQIDGHFYQNEGRYLVLDSNNFSTYTVTKTGTGASGTWGINISGNASTATSATSATNATNSVNSTYASLLAKQGGTSTAVSIWTPKSTYTKVWGQNFVDSNITTDTGDLVYYLRNSEYVKNGTELCIVIDGDFYAGSGQYKVLHEGNSSVSKSGETLTVKINGVTQSLTNTNTWRGITDSYNGTDNTISLSQKGAKALYDALAHSHPYLSTSGGTLSGTTGLTLTNSSIWIQGGSSAGGNSNRLTTTSGMPTDMQYNTSKRGTRIYSNGIAFCDPYNGNSNNDGSWIRHIETTANKSILEIAIGDDGESSEEIRFRKYNTSNNVAYDILVPMASGTLALTSQIPTSLPANGGNADTLDGYHASSFALSHSHNYHPLGGYWKPSSLSSYTRHWGWAYSSAEAGLASNGTEMQIYTDGKFWQREGAYYCLDNGNTYVSGGTGVINGSTITNVSYSSSTGYVANGNVSNLNTPSTWSSDGSRLVYDNYSGSASNKPVSHDNANCLITLFKTKHGTSGQYTSQLAFPDNGRIYHRVSQAGTWTGWGTIAFTSDIPSSLPANGGNADTVDGYHASSLWRSDGGTWNPSANIALNATANGQEWSFDITRNGKTGCYWHVWDSSLGSCLKVDADNGKVTACYSFNCASLQIGGETITFTT